MARQRSLDGLGGPVGGGPTPAELTMDGKLDAQLEEAISGRGAFRRFGDTLRRHEEEWQCWQLVRQERALGRARLWLEMHDVRPAV